MLTGRVKWYDAQKGFGYIMPEAGGPDVFVHASALPEGVRELKEDQPVQYQVQETPRGGKATSVQPV